MRKPFHNQKYVLLTFCLCMVIGLFGVYFTETKTEVSVPVRLGRELVAPLALPTPTPTPQTDYLSFFMLQNPVSRAERDNNFSMDIYFPDTRTSDEVACAQALLQYAGFYIDT